MPDTQFPEPAAAPPEAVLLRRERNRWLRHEANLVLGRGGADEPEAQQARTAHLVLTYALAIVEQRPAVIGSFDDLTRPRRDRN
ncbi:hypothetical protein [Amycolatopsis tolypomycina]|uniref:Uncharacterized protein n=1 Tax=Amycolatopsis tolypomycina TaxID=208445 RepID=A0A1H4U564_9PSEU|nr:hypothetical protein [Amycolatopsis tolypomycina]SEC63876.1 hypothetical protein SAMN04489727_4499 [Amycolatopsis tolypomycina]